MLDELARELVQWVTTRAASSMGIRLFRDIKLLAETLLRLSEIVYELSETADFSRAFCKQAGMSPGEHRGANSIEIMAQRNRYGRLTLGNAINCPCGRFSSAASKRTWSSARS